MKGRFLDKITTSKCKNRTNVTNASSSLPHPGTEHMHPAKTHPKTAPTCIASNYYDFGTSFLLFRAHANMCRHDYFSRVTTSRSPVMAAHTSLTIGRTQIVLPPFPAKPAPIAAPNTQRRTGAPHSPCVLKRPRDQVHTQPTQEHEIRNSLMLTSFATRPSSSSAVLA
ncbi:unnamed protein product [Ectocarpus sp. 12 AP-2014]